MINDRKEGLGRDVPDILNGAKLNDLREVQAAVLRRRNALNTVEDRTGFTALQYAVARGNFRIVKFLLSHEDIEMHHVDSFGRSPLDLAVEVGHQGVISALLNARANRG